MTIIDQKQFIIITAEIYYFHDIFIINNDRKTTNNYNNL